MHDVLTSLMTYYFASAPSCPVLLWVGVKVHVGCGAAPLTRLGALPLDVLCV